MAQCAPLYKEFFKMCPNGMIPNKKLQNGLRRTVQKNFDSNNEKISCNWVNSTCESLRKVARMYRMAKAEQKSPIWKKALGMNGVYKRMGMKT